METAGTAMKTIAARFQELKKAPSEIGEIDGEIIDANKIESALRLVGVSLRDAQGQFRDLDQVFLELASKWDSLDVNTQRYIATIAAGSRQQSRFIAMMSDYERTMELVDAANNSAGASQKQFNKTLDALSASTIRLQNSWHEFTMGLANNEVIKGTVDIANALLTVFNKIITVISGGNGLAKSVTTLALAFFSFKGVNKLIKQLNERVKKVAEQNGKTAGDTFATAFVKNLLGNSEAAYNAGKSLSESAKAGAEGKTMPTQATPTSQTNTSDVDQLKKAQTAARNLSLAFGAAAASAGLLASGLQKIGGENENVVKVADGISAMGAALGTTALILPTVQAALEGIGVAINASTLGWVGLALSAIVGIATVISNFYETTEERIERLNKEVEELNDELNKTQEEQSNLLTDQGAYEQQLTYIDSLITGTTEWKNAIKEANEQAKKMLDTYEGLEATVDSITGIVQIKNFNTLTEENEIKNKQNQYRSIALNYQRDVANWEGARKTRSKFSASHALEYFFGSADKKEKLQQEEQALLDEVDKMKAIVDEKQITEIISVEGLDSIAMQLFTNLDSEIIEDADKLQDAVASTIQDAINAGLENTIKYGSLNVDLDTLKKDFKDEYTEFIKAIEADQTDIEKSVSSLGLDFSRVFGLDYDTAQNITNQLNFLGDEAKQVFSDMATEGRITHANYQDIYNDLSELVFSTSDAIDGYARISDALVNGSEAQKRFAAAFIKSNEAMISKSAQVAEMFKFVQGSMEDLRKDGEITAQEIYELSTTNDKLRQGIEQTGFSTNTLAYYFDLLGQSALDSTADITGLVEILNAAMQKENVLSDVYTAIDNFKLDESGKKIGEFYKSARETVDEIMAAGRYQDKALAQYGELIYGDSYASVVEKAGGNMKQVGEQIQGLLDHFDSTFVSFWEAFAQRSKTATWNDATNSVTILKDNFKGINALIEEVQQNLGVSEEFAKAMVADLTTYAESTELFDTYAYQESINQFIAESGLRAGDGGAIYDKKQLKALAESMGKTLEEVQKDLRSQGIKLNLVDFIDPDTKGLSKELSTQIKDSIREGGEASAEGWYQTLSDMGLSTEDIESNLRTAVSGTKFASTVETVIENANGKALKSRSKDYEALGLLMGKAMITAMYEGTGDDAADDTALKALTDAFEERYLKVTNTTEEENKAAEAAKRFTKEAEATAHFTAETDKNVDAYTTKQYQANKAMAAGLSTMDRLWNLLERINEASHQRNLLEKEYNYLLKNNAISIKDATKAKFTNLTALRKEITLQEQYQTALKKQLELAGSAYGSDGQTYRNAFKAGKLKDYVSYNVETGTLDINQKKIDKLSADQFQVISSYKSYLEGIVSKLESTDSTLIDLRTEYADYLREQTGIIGDYMDTVRDAIVAREEELLDNAEQQVDLLSDSYNNIINKLQEQVDLDRQIRDNTKTEQDISDKAARLSYLRRDTSGANAAEIKKLEKELEDAREGYKDTLIDQAISDLNKRNEEMTDQMSQQIEIARANLKFNQESGVIWDTVNELIQDALKGGFEGSDLQAVLENYTKSDTYTAMNEYQQELFGEEAASAFTNAMASEEVAKGDFAQNLHNDIDAVSTALTTTEDKLKAKTGTIDQNAAGFLGGNYKTLYELLHGPKPIPVEIPEESGKTTVIKNKGGTYKSSVYETFFGDNRYATGGLNTSTGPAWLDGTPNHPELVLNAADTTNFLVLTDVLRTLAADGLGTSLGDSYYDIDINADIASDYDVDRLAARIKDEIVSSARYRNVNALSFKR